jgi:hypothetical protein
MWYEQRQAPEVWEAFGKWPAKGGLRSFVWEALWKKLPVTSRLKQCGMVRADDCVWGDGQEDMLHVVKGCLHLRGWFQVVSGLLGRAGDVEVSRLVTDVPAASLTTAQGALVWVGLWFAWKMRCDVVFREAVPSERWMLQAAEYIRGWKGMGELGLTREVCKEVAKGVERWWRTTSVGPRVLVQMRPARRLRRQ